MKDVKRVKESEGLKESYVALIPCGEQGKTVTVLIKKEEVDDGDDPFVFSSQKNGDFFLINLLILIG